MTKDDYTGITTLLKRIPLLKDIPAFSSIPEGLSHDDVRFYMLSNLLNSLGVLNHFIAAITFYSLGVYPMVAIALATVAILIVNIVMNRRGYHFGSILSLVLATLAYQFAAVVLLGWQAGFQYFIFALGTLPFLISKGNWGWKIFSLLSCFAAYLVAERFLAHATPPYEMAESTLSFLRLLNIAMCFIFQGISGGYFNVALYRTDAILAERNDQLIVAERKATLGKIATEMAHEIQNPINFVNNYAEVNTELFTEFREDSRSVKLPEDLNTLILDLEENNKKIEVNGKRVSDIVGKLREETRHF